MVRRPHFQAGLPFESHQPNLFLFTDVSDSGWGASLGDAHLSGLWTQDCSSFSINHQELTVLFSVRGFLPSLQYRLVASYANNNTTALAYLKKQGGIRSQTLNSVAQVILRLCEAHRIQLLPQFIPDKPNVLVNSKNHNSQVLGSEWTLCSEAFYQLLHCWPATIGLFTAALNHRLLVYFSPMVDHQSAGTDAVLQSWSIAKVRQSRGLELTLVAPFWTQHPWFLDLVELLVEIPFFLPRRRDLR